MYHKCTLCKCHIFINAIIVVCSLTQTTAVEYLKKLQEKVSLDSSSNDPNYFGHEIGTLNDILTNVTKTVSSSTTDSDAFLQVANWTVRIAQRIIKTPKPWHHLALVNVY